MDLSCTWSRDATLVVTGDSEFVSEIKDSPEGHLPEEVIVQEGTPLQKSVFDGRDIPRPPAIIVTDSQKSISAEEVVNTSGGDRETVIRVGNDQLGTMFMDEDYTDHPDTSVDSSNFALCMLADTGITIKEAMGGPDAEKWKGAIQLEDQGLENIKVITREECPVGIRPLNTKYVLTKKRDPEGTVERFEARQVVQGFHQVYGRDFL